MNQDETFKKCHEIANESSISMDVVIDGLSILDRVNTKHKEFNFDLLRAFFLCLNISTHKKSEKIEATKVFFQANEKGFFYFDDIGQMAEYCPYFIRILINRFGSMHNFKTILAKGDITANEIAFIIYDDSEQLIEFNKKLINSKSHIEQCIENHKLLDGYLMSIKRN